MENKVTMRTTRRAPEMEAREMMILFRACSDKDLLVLLLLLTLDPAAGPVLNLLELALPSKDEFSLASSIERLGLAPRPSSAADRLVAMKRECEKVR